MKTILSLIFLLGFFQTSFASPTKKHIKNSASIKNFQILSARETFLKSKRLLISAMEKPQHRDFYLSKLRRIIESNQSYIPSEIYNKVLKNIKEYASLSSKKSTRYWANDYCLEIIKNINDYIRYLEAFTW